MPMRIPGKRVALRDFEEKDLPFVWRCLQPGNAWRRTDGPYHKAASPEELKSAFDNLRNSVMKEDFPEPRTSLAIVCQDTDLLLGKVGSYWESRETNWLCAGIAIYDEKKWGRGLGYEALGLWVEYLFGAMPDIARLDLRTWSGNRGMMRLAEKLGFKLEARFRKARIVEGTYYDSLGYGILREEWRGLGRG